MKKFTGADKRRISLQEESKSKKLFLSHYMYPLISSSFRTVQVKLFFK